jgi:signal transduction histidine kinase
MHKLLERQLRLLLPEEDRDVVKNFLVAVEDSYRDADEQVALLKATIESTVDGTLAVDERGEIVAYNQRFVELWDIPEGFLAGGDAQAISQAVSEKLDDPGQFLSKMVELEGQPEKESHDRLRLRDGRMIDRYSLPRFVDKRFAGRVWSFRDVSERHRLEERMRQAEKMEAVGRLVGGIAHDFNNLLTVIKGYCELCQESPDGKALDRQLTQIHLAAQQASDLTGQLLSYSRQQMLEPRILDLHDTVAGLKPMLERLMGADIELVFDLAAEASTILADEGRVQQVVMNLVINARDAMPSGGRITLRTENGEVDRRFIDPHKTEILAGQMVLLRVRDDGHGIAPEHQERIFEPFFTTKASGAGTGLGLATVYGIVKQSQGYVWVDSTLGQGTELTIALPKVQPEEKSRQLEEPGSPPEEVLRSRILVVEDDSLVRDILEEVLAKEHEVHVATDPQQALDLLGSNAEFDLLVTDIVLPGMSGLDLAELITTKFCRTKVLFISGYNPDAYRHQGILREGANFLSKPFNPRQLLHKIRDVLTGESGTS